MNVEWVEVLTANGVGYCPEAGFFMADILQLEAAFGDAEPAPGHDAV